MKKTLPLSLIAALGENRVIGVDNSMPWHLPADFKYFKATTLGKPIIMGRKTWDSLGRPLPGRLNLVVSRQTDLQLEGAEVFASLQDAVARAEAWAQEQGVSEVMLIGGAQLYAQGLEQASAEQLEKINDTGYAPFYVGLSKGTSYTLLVYADNGYNGKLFAVEQTTAGKADPLQRKYTIDDLYVFSDKAQLFKTWNLWGISNDGSGKTARSKIGQVVFSENETDDTNNLDAINVAGLSLGANNEDTVVWEWYNGIIYVLKGQPMGTIPYLGATLYLKYYILDKEKSKGADTIDGMMVGGVTEDGYLALICGPDWSDQYNFDTILVKAYTDANYTNSIGNWESYTSPLMVPATGSNTGAAAPRKVASDKMLTLSKEISINPSNYVELRGRERAHALIDELFGKPVNRGANPLEGEVSVRIATPAMSSFSEGFAPRANTLQSGGMEKMPLKKMAK